MCQLVVGVGGQLVERQLRVCLYLSSEPVPAGCGWLWVAGRASRRDGTVCLYLLSEHVPGTGNRRHGSLIQAAPPVPHLSHTSPATEARPHTFT
jgi:hypothetical protein